MKKILFSLIVLIYTTSLVFSQDPVEKKLGLKPIELKTIAFEKTNIDCNCKNNFLQDGGFEKLTVGGGSIPSDISTSSAPWKKGYGTPQWSPDVQSPCNKGIVTMWGNKTVGESIYQNGLSFTQGCYTVKFTARLLSPTTLAPFVRLKLATYNGTGAPSTYDPAGLASQNITSTSWQTYTFSFTTNTANSISLHPENDYLQNNGDYVSRIQIDNICIEKCCEIPDEKCNPKFTAAPFTVNSQGNVIINVNPAVTSGAQHYWGLLGASGIGDNTPIPLSTIIAGGSFGLAINSSGSTATIGMGTGINASTSGYGYSYQGVDVGKCFKITHYIKCCGKWYTQTNTYCTKLCSEVKESPVTEVNPKDVPNLDGRPGDGKG
jgi:hypothetical protein